MRRVAYDARVTPSFLLVPEADPYQFAVLRALPDRDVLLVAVGVAVTDARRETHEETGVTPLDQSLWTVVSGPGALVHRGKRRAFDVTAVCRATRHAGELTVGDESTRVAWFSLNALPASVGSTERTVARALLSGTRVPILTVP